MLDHLQIQIEVKSLLIDFFGGAVADQARVSFLEVLPLLGVLDGCCFAFQSNLEKTGTVHSRLPPKMCQKKTYRDISMKRAYANDTDN